MPGRWPRAAAVAGVGTAGRVCIDGAACTVPGVTGRVVVCACSGSAASRQASIASERTPRIRAPLRGGRKVVIEWRGASRCGIGAGPATPLRGHADDLGGGDSSGAVRVHPVDRIAPMLTVIVAFAVSLALTLLVVHSASGHAWLTHDNDFSGPQKFHSRPVPRVGGVGIVAGLLAAAGLLAVRFPDERWTALVLLACGAPAFAAGLVEDLTKRVSPRGASAVHGHLGGAGGRVAVGQHSAHHDSGARLVRGHAARCVGVDGVRRRGRGQLGEHHRRVQRPGLDVRGDHAERAGLRGLPGR